MRYLFRNTTTKNSVVKNVDMLKIYKIGRYKNYDL